MNQLKQKDWISNMNTKLINIANGLKTKMEERKDTKTKLLSFEHAWRTALESNDRVLINDADKSFNETNAAIIYAVFLDTQKLFLDISGVLKASFFEPTVLEPLVLAVSSESAKMKDISYYAYPIEAQLIAAKNLQETSKIFFSGILSVMGSFKTILKSDVEKETIEKNMAELHEFVDFVKSNPVFGAKTMRPLALEPSQSYLGDALIYLNKLRNQYHDFFKAANRIPEKLEIVAKRFAEPTFSRDLHELSHGCRDFYREIILTVTALSSRVVCLADNLESIQEAIISNYNSLNDASNSCGV